MQAKVAELAPSSTFNSSALDGKANAGWWAAFGDRLLAALRAYGDRALLREARARARLA